jgi:hypothetical protein
MGKELDDILGVPPATPAGEADDVQKRVDEATAKVKDALLNRVDSLQGKIETLEKENESLRTTVKPLEALKPKEEVQEEFDVSTAEGWKTHIESTSETAANKAVDQVKQSAWNKAKESFLASHKGYDPAKLEGLIPKAKGIGIKDEFDKDSIADALDDAWTVENKSELRKQAELAARLQAQNDQNLTDLASSGGSNPVKQGMDSPNATRSDLNAYREYQRTGGEMPLDKFLEFSRNA